ncbi:glycoside hydrolase family 28 protein [Croceibacterium mercuriale]|uniref:glycoside hydrolase family 28 protein n=1 Tax=Croceibacterium mercuriale TaxID=1572751 RepID=UPI00068E00ED|nr:glycosyl hydrolase family 28 protein [Croceibacterium mercuriale]
MSIPDQHRRATLLALLAAPFLPTLARAAGPADRRVDIRDAGALADGSTINTTAIQSAIDRLAGQDGGTIVVPAGVFVSGALFLKPGVHLHLAEGAVLRCAADVATHFPARRTRIEGHVEEHFTPALINAAGCHGLRITGPGTLDGDGRAVWDLFWQLRRASADPRNFPNIGIPRARLALIEGSRDVRIEGVTFRDSQFWNLHLHACQDVVIRDCRFTVPDDYERAPSTDGIDLDSCQRVTVEGCYFSVTDDCIAAKGSRGPLALEDRSSPPVEHIRVRNCEFRRGGSVFTCGSEATIVRDVLVEDCRVTGDVRVLVLKLRTDTPQLYEDIELRRITLAADGGQLFTVQPWTQYARLDGHPPPSSAVRNIRMIGVTGRYGAFGSIRPNPEQTDMSDVLLKDIDVQLARRTFTVSGMRNLRLENVVANGVPVREASPAAG